MRSQGLEIMMVLSIFLLLIVAWGCNNNVRWSKSYHIPSDGWLPDDFIIFNLDPVAYLPKPDNRFAEMTAKAAGDTAERYLGRYKAVIAIRYLDNCNVTHLSLATEKAGLDEPIVTDTITFPLFNNEGQPLGKGNLRILETSLEFSPFVVGNGTTLSLHPIASADTVKGITDVTLLLNPL